MFEYPNIAKNPKNLKIAGLSFKNTIEEVVPNSTYIITFFMFLDI